MRSVMWGERRGCGTVCLCSSSPLLTTRSMQWISTLSIVVLSLVHATGIRKQFLAPIFALQAPNKLVSWIKGDYGMLSAFMALLVRLFFPIPDELDLPLPALLMVAVTPYEIMQFRGTREAAVLSLVVAGYLAFQYFSRIGTLKKAFDRGSIVATLAVICITVTSSFLLP